ncbi:hypothetical protein CYMTET_45172 [Cymbomonas tetramitiformis]|uniref:ATPase AAA-type core domain-containing protein n=1 Tax=Cymbomonas tetramitiformis TaxID=36881 RepID=A0AAE0BYR8_9CHLO|nr:hypothetical protein CYMTET_45172 [Cymbomonas tetramitiformis]
MANVTFDIQWREAMMELLDQLEAENPEDPTLAPRDLAEFSCIYIKYLQIFKKLEECYDQMVHPQKRLDIKKALEGTIGRILEIKSWMVKLNGLNDCVQLDDILVDLKLAPDVLEIPTPRYYVENRSKELDDRGKFLDALVEKYNVKRPREDPIKLPPPLPEEEAIRVIQVNERGRQGRERARIMREIRRQQAFEEKIARMGGRSALSQEEAATRMQAAARGFISRTRTKQITEAELVFIGMKPPQRDPAHDPQIKEQRNLQRRKLVQAENQAEYDKALITLKTKVREMEGQDMRETIQDRVNTWFVENRNPDNGEYPDFPDEDEGGSKIILNPVPKEEPLDEPAPDPKAKKDAKKDPKKDDKGKGKKGKGKDDAPVEEKKEECPDYFVKLIEGSVQDYVNVWQDRDESTNFFQKYDAELVKDSLRGVVFEEVRVDVDEEMRVLLQNLKDMVAAEKAAKSGKKGKKGKKNKGKKAKGKKKKDKGKKGKGKKDLTADRSMESLYAELVSNNIIQPIPKAKVQDYLGGFNYLGATLEKASIIPDPSMAQVRQLVSEYGILPMASRELHEKVPWVKTMLFYGLPKSGKTLLSYAVANGIGANFFNLSPRNTDGKYPGKAVQLMIHMVFKVAKTMAPSVIYIDEVEKVFISDKKKMKEFGGMEPFSRIKKELLKEIKQLGPGDRVLIVGNTQQPYLCVKKDEKAFMDFFQKHILFPLPDYASMRLLWPGLVEKHGGKLTYEFDLSTLAHIADSYSAGTLNQVVRLMLSDRRVEKLDRKPLTVKEVLNFLCKFEPVHKDTDQALRDWTNKLPYRRPKNPDGTPMPLVPDKKKKKK